MSLVGRLMLSTSKAERLGVNAPQRYTQEKDNALPNGVGPVKCKTWSGNSGHAWTKHR